MQNFIKSTILVIVLSTMIACTGGDKKADTDTANSKEVKTEIATRWSEERAQQWGAEQPWLVGANFNPSTAINQLETWQAESFDIETIDRELGWAENIGMNTMRVYLHHVAWQVDKEGFKKRINQFLEIAQAHGIKPMFVFFDDCWNPVYKAGQQPEPKAGVHNSGWVQDPGTLLYEDATLINSLEVYVKDILTTFKNDDRILLWDLYNEPGNSKHGNKSMPLLKKVFAWSREINPSQPLSAGIWNKELTDLNKFQLDNSDIITYHNYEDPKSHQADITRLQLLNRPLICTEYMARRNNSLFTNILPILARENVGAINWGLVDGRSNTKYAWDEPIADGSEPTLWFHEVFKKDGSAYKQSEVDLIKKLTSEKN
jgi:hypothetical protein